MGTSSKSRGKVVALFAGLPAIGLLAPAMSSGAVISVGTPTLLANNASQTFPILVTGTDQIEGANLYIQINDGGTDNNGTSTAPKMTSVTVLQSPAIFSTNNTGQELQFTPDQMIANDDVNTTSTASGPTTILDSGVLAYVTVSTLGLPVGTTFTVSLGDVAPGIFGSPGLSTSLVSSSATQFQPTEPGVGGVPAATITLIGASVPEPTSITLLAVAAAGLVRRRRASI